jgi:excisionase family DNA binding protein
VLSDDNEASGEDGNVPAKVTQAGANRQVAPAAALGLPLLVTVEEASTLLRLGRTRTYEFIRCGLIKSVKVGRSRLVVRSSLEEFVDVLVAAQCGPLA